MVLGFTLELPLCELTPSIRDRILFKSEGVRAQRILADSELKPKLNISNSKHETRPKFRFKDEFRRAHASQTLGNEVTARRTDDLDEKRWLYCVDDR